MWLERSNLHEVWRRSSGKLSWMHPSNENQADANRMWAAVLFCFPCGQTPLGSYYSNDDSSILLQCTRCSKHPVSQCRLALCWLYTPLVCQAKMTIRWCNGFLWIAPLVSLVFQLISHHDVSLSLFLSLLSTDSSLTQAVTTRIPLSMHIYTNIYKNREKTTSKSKLKSSILT